MVDQSSLLMETVKIYQIRYQNQRKDFWERNKNFEEFRMVYQNVIHDRTEQRKSIRSGSHVRMKTVTIELPTLGSERAILDTKKNHKVLKPILKKTTEMKEAHTLTQDIVGKLTEMETPLKNEVLMNKSQFSPSGFLEKTNRELQIAEEQLSQLKSVIRERHEKPRSTKNPSYKSKNKINTRHGRRYLSTLSNMQQMLKKLDDKYFKKPRIVYRTVNNTFTQSRSVEVLYENEKYPDNNKMDDTLKGIMNDLDDLATGKVEDNSCKPRNITFKHPNYKKCPISSTIEMSESRLKKLRNYKQDIRDVEDFCDQLYNLTQSEDLCDSDEEIQSENRRGKEFWKKQLLDSRSHFKNDKYTRKISDPFLYDNKKKQKSSLEYEIVSTEIDDILRNANHIYKFSDNEELTSKNYNEACREGCRQNSLSFLNLGSNGDQNISTSCKLRKLAMESAIWIEEVAKKKDNSSKISSEGLLSIDMLENSSVTNSHWKPGDRLRNDDIEVENFIINHDNKPFQHSETGGNQERDSKTEVCYDVSDNFQQPCLKKINPFENCDIQGSIMKSYYLMKEFNIDPKMKMNIDKKVQKLDDVAKYHNYGKYVV